MDPNKLVSIIDLLRDGLIPSLESCAQEVDQDNSTIQQQLGEIQTLEAAKQELLVRVGQLEAGNLDKDEEIAGLKAEIKRLENELARYQPPPPPPPPPPIEVSPDIEIGLFGQTFRPGLKGERVGRETRYRIKVNEEVDALIDIKDDKQVRVCIERCHVDLPVLAPVIETKIDIVLGSALRVGGLGQEIAGYSNFFRLHPHTRPPIVFNQSAPPKVSGLDRQALILSGLIPNYSPLTTYTDTDLDKMAKGSYPWEKWEVKWPISTHGYDPISEVYGPVIRSWTGGANETMNEAHHLAPVQVAYLMTQDERAWDEVVDLANSSGNYAVHYRGRDGRFPRADETLSLPFLQGDSQVTLYTAKAMKLPIPEPAHEHSLTYLAHLLTRDRWYLEELKAWAGYNLLTRPKDQNRLKGIVWSGQVRAAAWSIRALLNVTLACKLAGDEDYERYKAELIANLNWMRDMFTVPGQPEYRATGVCSLSPFRPADLLTFVTLLPRPKYFASWNHHVMASVANECVRAGFPEAIPIRDHLTRVVQGQWQYGQSKYDIGWGNHAFVLDRWEDIVRTTFEGRPTPPTSFPVVTTPEYIAWARSAVVAAVDAGQEWAREALNWIDREAPKYKGGIPAAWRIEPSAK